MPTNVMQQLSLSVILLLTTSLASKMHFSAYQCVVLPMTTLHTCNCYSICTIQTLLPGSTYQWERIPDIHTAEENVTCDMHDELSSQAGCETACAAHSQFHWLLCWPQILSVHVRHMVMLLQCSCVNVRVFSDCFLTAGG